MLRDAGQRLRTPPAIVFSLKRLSLLLVLLVLPLLLGAQGQKPEDQILYRGDFLQVVTPDKLSVEQGKKATAMFMAAWKFDLDVMRWTNPAEVQAPVTLRLLSAERMKRDHLGFRAMAANNGKRITMNANLVDDPSGPLTLAHESGHIQAARVVGKRWGQHAVPLYFIEGHGLFMNRLYADHLRISSPRDWVKNVRTIMSLSAQEARVILTDDSYSNNEKDGVRTFKMECMGAYFVEYMRVRYNGRGIPDMVPKMGRVFEQVRGGKTYKQAFKQVYGVSVDQIISEIVELFKHTEANPMERYKGTRFEVASQVVAGQSRK